MNPLLRPLAWLRRNAHRAGALVLAGWAIGLVIAGLELDAWRQELTRTLLQLHADAQFRARAQHREAVDPAWYRRKALSLLAATDRLRHDAAWTLFVPGSWQVFDDLEERVEARISREFGEIVVETLRRELMVRASELTGVPLQPGTGDLVADAECVAPLPKAGHRRLSAAAEDLPEFRAVADYVAAVEELDAAAQSLAALQQSGGQPEQLRRVVAYALKAELPGSLANSVRMFHTPDEVSVQPALLRARLQWATRCSLGKAMAALHHRLLHTNELFALEQGLAERSTGLFDPRARPAPFDRVLERYRAVHALLQDQHALLARGRNGWMRQASLQLGPSYDEVLVKIEKMQLFGPDAVRELQEQSGAAFAEFRRMFQATFGERGDPGIVWLETEQRFGLSPERTALREGLGTLLQAPFMAEARKRPASAAAAPWPAAAEEARSLAAARDRFARDTLPRFPQAVQPAVERVVNARVSELVYDVSYRALRAGLPDPARPLDPETFRRQREQAGEVQELLQGMQAGVLAHRLAAVLDQELLRRLAVIHEDWKRQPLHDARQPDLAGWQGETLPVWQAVGAADAASVGANIARLGSRLDVLSQQADTLLALGSPRLADDPAALRWTRLKAELARYHARHPDSSLLRLERYLAGLGPDLRRENCAERMATAAPPPHDDDIAERLLQIQRALSARCGALRFEQAPPAVAPATSAAQ